MKRYVLVLAFLLILVQPAHAEDINAGFVQGLWYSEETVFVDAPTRIYVALRNNTEHDLTGEIIFTDNGRRIGTSQVSALSGRLVEAWVDWVPTHGDHTIKAFVNNAKLHVIGKGTESIDMTSVIAEDTVYVDYDTDKDGIVNEVDTDDDNDEVSDTDEKARGTNPLVSNPKEVQADVVEKPKEETKPETEKPKQENNTERAEGLEKFIENSPTDALLSSLTSKVENTKQSLDSYREERNADRVAQSPDEETETKLGTYTNNATITRTKIETNNSFLSSFVSGVATLIQSIYTFLLWLVSRALSFPALIELLLLLGILYFFYRTARRFGRRPNM